MDVAMKVALISGLLAGVFAVVVQLIANNTLHHKEEVLQAKREQKLDDKLNEIDKKLEEHNNYAKKFGEISESLVKMETDIKYLKEGLFDKDKQQ